MVHTTATGGFDIHEFFTWTFGPKKRCGQTDRVWFGPVNNNEAQASSHDAERRHSQWADKEARWTFTLPWTVCKKAHESWCDPVGFAIVRKLYIAPKCVTPKSLEIAASIIAQWAPYPSPTRKVPMYILPGQAVANRKSPAAIRVWAIVNPIRLGYVCFPMNRKKSTQYENDARRFSKIGWEQLS
jgi:hypothetical protein